MIPSVLRYNLEDYNFVPLINTILNVDHLMTLGCGLDFTMDDAPAADQKSPWHEAFYRACTANDPFMDLYTAFVINVVIPGWSKEECYYQRVPTLRISLPNGKAVGGTIHRDRDYGHPQGEMNFIVPLTHMFGTNAMFTESKPDLGDFNFVDVPVGSYLGFDGCNCRHGNVRNNTGFTRVSFDFRILPKSLFDEEKVQRTMAHGLSFRPGDYYA